MTDNAKAGSLNALQACRPEETRIFLLRHGEVEGHGEPRYNGQQDVALTPRGRGHYRQLVERLQPRPIQAVYSSDLVRCFEGAEMLAAAHGLVPVAMQELRELHAGEWEGRPWSELQAHYPTQWQARLDDIVHYRIPGGENLLDLRQRARSAVAEIIGRHRGQEVVVVAHGGINRILLLDALDAPLERILSLSQFYGCVNILDYGACGRVTVQLLNG
ncbi:MAG: alpha-ribazole phosphatase [Desulfuromonadales bacterium C00003094]|jgi:alpha-ribazole phosphatase/probable phosphoglycerate mutase|nr:MAG: alpha-ribazole phosphatase [Desulfuromonadales bacterium C00003094]OEU74463.1 MAG: alpha-ribazole phosphatase [Desulfuromonadales bacterium C00003107]